MNFLSLGAGVQSSTLALMYAKKELTPLPDFAIFADTQNEPKEVYDWLDWLENQLNYPVYRVTKGNLAKNALIVKTSKKTGKKYIPNTIPFFFIKDNKSKGFLNRGCTLEYKIKPINKFVKNFYKIKHLEKNPIVNRIMGISTDEITRMTTSKQKWAKNVYPLIENNMSRNDCIDYFKKNNLPKPPRSACLFCPYHSDNYWNYLKNNSKSEFQQAIKFDKLAKKAYSKTFWWQNNYSVSVHKSGNLEKFDKINSKQLNLFDSECEGICGV
jgi:hypothetical protein